MRWTDVNFDASPRVLRQFAGLALAVLGAAAAWSFAHGRPIAGAVQAAIAVGVGVPGLVRPRSIRHVFGVAMLAAFPIGWGVSQVLLAVVYFGLFTPMAWLFRLRGRDLLRRRFVPEAETYWEPKPQATGPKQYFQQF